MRLNMFTDHPVSHLYFQLNFSDKTIKANVQRVIKIWEERRLFEKDYLEALKTKLGMILFCKYVVVC